MKKLFKAVTIEVLSTDNKRVLSRHRFVADESNKKVRFTEAGVDQVINTFVTKFEIDNPGHQYRLAECAGAKFRLVWGDHAPVRKSRYTTCFTDARAQIAALEAAQQVSA